MRNGLAIVPSNISNRNVCQYLALTPFPFPLFLFPLPNRVRRQDLPSSAEQSGQINRAFERGEIDA